MWECCIEGGLAGDGYLSIPPVRMKRCEKRRDRALQPEKKGRGLLRVRPDVIFSTKGGLLEKSIRLNKHWVTYAEERNSASGGGRLSPFYAKKRNQASKPSQPDTEDN